MIQTPVFLDTQRPADVPNLVVPRGVTPFHLAGRPVRGRLVRLGPLADVLLTRRDLPAPITRLGGEALALVAGLSAGLKFKGAFSLQIKGDGPVSTLVADCTDMGEMRLYIRADAETALATPKELLGEGYFAFTIDQGAHTDRHQGIVAITGDRMADMATHYFETSEQHACWMRLFCTHTDAGWQAGGIILERIATEGGASDLREDIEKDPWETACVLAETLSEGELFDPALSAETLLERLFGTLDVMVGQPRALSYGCRCSRAKLAGVLENFPVEDLDHMAEDGTIVMTCDFCNIDFRFARDEVGRHIQDEA
ncbi:Hsp33 family molecular chaperone HslO [Kozakia baliensis]|uniref:Heat-shock protein Hsp33 n=1 Tax=Kozakia baliensis TaxID=153496 RepID=A0A1D8UVM8_9PROT|nr:Hsp33 family molecular chaperone HslO [Kozakia baliensis]AOX17703.1 heat-shock protein Hsp33 [Kozakia baliensis]GBR31594.1 heat shock protein Hsp33 [Kozakia baliensis NRIC 0488]GEL62786.1 33 kDa chaperonin [Kozakia baliensis]